MKKNFGIFMAGLACVALASCGSKGSGDNDYVSVQLEDSQMWSLMDVKNGSLVMTDEFFAPSSSVVNGSFFVEDDNGEFDLYNLKDTKNKLNRSSYSVVTNFNPQGFAIVRVKDEPWQIIDTEGTVVATLDKTLNVMSGFSDEGMAMIKNKDGMIGYVDTKGQNPIKPRYKLATIFSDGVAFVLTKEENNHNYMSAINPAGETLFTFSDAKYATIGLFNDGYAFAVEGDHSVLLDKTGKKIMTVCNSTEISNLSYLDGKIIYYDGEFYGVKDLEDKILIRAKYQSLTFQSDGKLVAKNSSGRYGVISDKDDIVMPFDYEMLEYVAPDRYITKSGSVYVLIDEKGKEISEKAFTNYSIRTSTSSEASQTSLISSKTNSAQTENVSDNYYLNLMNLDDMAYPLYEVEEEEYPSFSSLPSGGSLDQFYFLSATMLTPEDLMSFTKPELRVLRNAIFARHGYMFQSEDLRQYFSQFYDYTPYTRNVTDFNTIENANVALIKAYE